MDMDMDTPIDTDMDMDIYYGTELAYLSRLSRHGFPVSAVLPLWLFLTILSSLFCPS
jgi:hypothetical protein